MNDISQIALQILPAFDVVAAILVTLYISVAIFAAQNLFKPTPDFELSISGKSYVKLLSLVDISLMLIAIPLIVRIGSIDFLSANYHNSKTTFILLVLVALVAGVLYKIHGIITQKALENKSTKKVTHPSLKFTAWLIMNEPDWSVQKRDLLAGSLASTNKSDLHFEEFLLEQLKSVTDKLTSAKTKSRDHSDYLVSIVNVLKENWQNKPLGYPPYIDSVYDYLFQNWLKITNDKDLYSAGGIYNLRLAFMHGYNSLASYSLANGFGYDLFTNLSKFVNTLDGKDLQKFLLSFDDKIFFEYIPRSPESSIIWSDCFPEEWKLTYQNLVKKPNPVAANLLSHFLNWSQNRFFRDKGIDTELDDVATHLFPEVDPIIWARILEFRFAPWTGDEHLRYIISKVSTFGFGKSYSVQNYIDDATTIKHMHTEDEKMMEATIKLTTGLKMYSPEFIAGALAEVKKLGKDKTLDDREKRKLTQHKVIFTRLKLAESNIKPNAK